MLQAGVAFFVNVGNGDGQVLATLNQGPLLPSDAGLASAQLGIVIESMTPAQVADWRKKPCHGILAVGHRSTIPEPRTRHFLFCSTTSTVRIPSSPNLESSQLPKLPGSNIRRSTVGRSSPSCEGPKLEIAERIPHPRKLRTASSLFGLSVPQPIQLLGARAPTTAPQFPGHHELRAMPPPRGSAPPLKALLAGSRITTCGRPEKKS